MICILYHGGVHFLSVSNFGAVSSFRMFCFVKDDKKRHGGY